MERTDTTNQQIFQAPGPESATFDFSNRNHIRITIPSNSTWYTRSHWHQSDPGCERIDCIDGKLLVGYAVKPLSSGDDFIPAGSGDKFFMNARCYWRRSPLGDPATVRRLEVVLTVADEALYRNTCSAALDADKFPRLASTPIYLRMIFAVLWPTARTWLINRLLWVQLQAMNHAHGYFEYHGEIPLTSFWRLAHPIDTSLPPKRLAEIQWRSADIFSRGTQTICYWVGRLALGMRGEYLCYTPSPGHFSEAVVEKR